MEHGDIVFVSSTEQYALVLKVKDPLAQVLYYDFSVAWELIDECTKAGSSDAIFKVMYDIKSCEKIFDERQVVTTIVSK